MIEKSKTDRIGRMMDAVMEAVSGDYAVRIEPYDQDDDLDALADVMNGAG